MSKGYRTLAVAAAALILLIGVGTALAQTTDGGQTPSTPGQNQAGQGHRRGMRHHGMFGYMARQLQLTAAQKAQIKTMLQAQKATSKPLLQQLANYRQQMLTATAGGAFNQANVTTIAQGQAGVLAQLIVVKEQLKSQIYNQVLTAEQRTKADQLQQQRLQRMENWLNKPAGGTSR